MENILATERLKSYCLNLLSSPDVRANSPERCADEETDVLAQLEERALETELIHHRVQDETCDDLQHGKGRWTGLQSAYDESTHGP